MSISISENSRIIKPSYTSNDVKKIYEGSEPDKEWNFKNPCFRFLFDIQIIMFVAWSIYIGCAIYSGLINKYIYEISKLQESFQLELEPFIQKYINSITNNNFLSIFLLVMGFLGWIAINILYYFIALFPFIILPIMINAKVHQKIKKSKNPL